MEVPLISVIHPPKNRGYPQGPVSCSRRARHIPDLTISSPSMYLVGRKAPDYEHHNSLDVIFIFARVRLKARSCLDLIKDDVILACMC